MPSSPKYLVLAAMLAFAMPAAAEPAKFDFDPGHTRIFFTINHLGYSTQTGLFRNYDGHIWYDAAKPENSKVDITIPVAGLDMFNDKLNEHLQGGDFFDAAKYPSMTFTSTKVVKTGENTGAITGNLTLHGVTKPVTLNVTLNKAGQHPMLKKDWLGFSATGSLKRSDFGMGAYVPMVGDEVTLNFAVEAGKAD